MLSNFPYFPYWADKSNSDRRWRSLVAQGRKTFNEFRSVRVVDGGLPYVRSGSRLTWFPVVKRVCLLPVKEGEDANVEGWDLNRPIFYSEVDSERKLMLDRRCSVLRKRKRGGHIK